MSAIPPPKHSPHQPYLPQPQNDESTAQQKPITTTFQPLATSTTTTKSTIDFVKPPVNEHDIDPPAAASAAANDEKEVVKEEDDKNEVKHKIVTQQPQIHPGELYYVFFICFWMQGGMDNWSVYYTSPQSLVITFFIRWLNNFGDFLNFD